MNTQTAGFAVLLLDAAIALFSFFVVAPCVLNAVSLFGVQKQFARTMIDEGVISEEAVQRLHTKKQIAGVIVSVCWWPFSAASAGATHRRDTSAAACR